MAVKPATVVTNNFGVCVVTWADLDSGDTGEPVQLAQFSDKTVQMIGTSTDVKMQGSNDGTTWATMSDTAGTEITFIASGQLETLLQNPLYIRPISANGTDVTMILVTKAVGK